MSALGSRRRSSESATPESDSADAVPFDPFDQDFSSTYDGAQFRVMHMQAGRQVDALLTQRDNLVRMATASDLGRPAAQIMAARIKNAFPALAGNHLFRQYIGHRIRHIMSLLGYELDQPNVRIPNGVLFTCAARYRKRSDDGGNTDEDGGGTT